MVEEMNDVLSIKRIALQSIVTACGCHNAKFAFGYLHQQQQGQFISVDHSQRV